MALVIKHALVDGPAYVSGWVTQIGLGGILKEDMKLEGGRKMGSEFERIRGKVMVNLIKMDYKNS